MEGVGGRQEGETGEGRTMLHSTACNLPTVIAANSGTYTGSQPPPAHYQYIAICGMLYCIHTLYSAVIQPASEEGQRSYCSAHR